MPLPTFLRGAAAIALLVATLLAACSGAGTAVPPRQEPGDGAASGPTPERIVVRDVGVQLGLPRATTSWGVYPGHLDDDRTIDLVIGYHRGVVFYRNTKPGLERIFKGRGDIHGCTTADVNGDGLGDVYCPRGAGHGRIVKANSLWVQTSPGRFRDLSRSYGVTDPLGRGHWTRFLDIDHDPYPDLFVGNATPRRDGLPSPNRTFIGGAGEFRERDLGLTEALGAICVQVVDQDADGWDDLLLCGGRRLYLFRNEHGRRFHDVLGSIDFGDARVESAWVADLDGDSVPDLATVSESRLEVRAGSAGGSFGEPIISRPLRSGRAIAVGDVDGRRGPDVYVVQACAAGTNLVDLLLLNRPGRWRFDEAAVPQARRGCGDVATAVDLNEDGRDELIVMNGRPHGEHGPVQVLTTRWP